jgi:hypothetical protein
MTIYLIILILLIIVIYFGFNFYTNSYINKICNNLEHYNYGVKTDTNKTILILGGIHGNEPAGSKAILSLMNDINTNKTTIKHKLILVPYTNYCALQMNTRLMPQIGDLNRKFPTKIKYDENKLNPIIKKLLEFIKEADFIIDFHEGWGFYKENNSSIGSTITPANTELSMTLSDLIYNTLNNNINENNKKFTILIDDNNKIKTDTNKYGKNVDIDGTLRNYVNLLNKDYLLIETSGQKNIQPLDLRINQDRIVIDTVLLSL